MGSHDAKCAWSGVVHNERHDNDMMPAFDTSRPRDHDIPEDASQVVADICLESCPETVSVQLLIDRNRIDYFLRPVIIKEEEETQDMDNDFGITGNSNMDAFQQRMDEQKEQCLRVSGMGDTSKLLSSPYLRSDVPEEVDSLEKFRLWLAAASPGTSVHNKPYVTMLPPQRYCPLYDPSFFRQEPRDVNMVLLARRDGVPKGANMEEVLAGHDPVTRSLRARCRTNAHLLPKPRHSWYGVQAQGASGRASALSRGWWYACHYVHVVP